MNTILTVIWNKTEPDTPVYLSGTLYAFTIKCVAGKLIDISARINTNSEGSKCLFEKNVMVKIALVTC